MGSFLMNNNTYSIKSETQLAILLSNFDSSYVFGILDDILSAIDSTFDPMEKPNIVNSFEANFISVLNDYPEDRDNVFAVRDECYECIIDKISKKFKFEFRFTDDQDNFTVARLLYDFFVSSYHKNVMKFLATIISEEKDALYNSLNIEQFSNSSDTFTESSKSIFSDNKIALIISHLDYVLQYMTGMDFSMEQILEVVYGGNEYIINTFLLHVFPIEDFYRQFYAKLLANPNIFPLISTNMKFELFRRFSNKQLNLV